MPDSAFAEATRAHQAGQIEQAQALYERILEAHPDHAVVLHLLGSCHLQRRAPGIAIPFIARAIAARPGFAEAHGNLGAALNALGRHHEAVVQYEQALAIKPDFAEAHNNLGNALAALRRYDEAIVQYESALTIRPRYPEAHKAHGDVLSAVGRYDDACVRYEAALALRPGYVDAHGNLAVALAALGRHDEAVARFDRAIALTPGYAEAYYDQANSLVSLGRCDEAILRYEQAVALEPGHAAAHYNLGTVLAAQNRHDRAVDQYERALASDPAYPEAAWNRSLSLLALGRYREGWHGYEARWSRAAASTPPNGHVPRWTGREDVTGRTVLIQHEQGYGDALQMLRFVPSLEQAGARCAIQTPQALFALLTRSFPAARVVPLGNCPADADLRISAMSLPLALGTFTESAIPRDVPYLVADRAKTAQWRAQLGAQLGARRAAAVGLVWRGLGTHANDRHRSVALEALTPLLRRTHIRFVTLQKGLTQAEREHLARHDNVLALDEALTSFDDTAAVMPALDLVISVDSAPAHLSGALGLPTWVLLPFSSDWRWLLARDDSPWYPTARLFRQATMGDWAAVIAQVGAALDAHVAPGQAAPNGQPPP
ncbi:MAG: tetratricopeptide repeat protein [Gemmatimonadaceae bacterium]